MSKKIYFEHPETGQMKTAKLGIHWFGMVFPLLSGNCDFGRFVKEHIMGVLIIPWFSAHKRLVADIQGQGFRFKAYDGGTKELAESKLGFRLT